MRQKNDNLIKKFGVFKFKDISKMLKSVSLGKGKSFMQQGVINWKKIRHEDLQKRSNML